MARQYPVATTRDLHAQITDQIIAAIEANPAAPCLPWRRSGTPLHLPRNALTGRSYTGINILALWANALRSGYAQSIWATYKQWTQLGAQVRRGEKGAVAVFYKTVGQDPRPETTDSPDPRRIARASFVFNIAQVTGYAAHTEDLEASAPDADPLAPSATITALLTGTKADVRYGGDRAFYHRQGDFIQMPDRARFIGTATSSAQEGHDATLLHELSHWSGAAHRLNRTFGDRFGDQAYAMEELVAEIAAAFLCADLAITPETRPDHAQYIHHWLALLRHDKRAIFVAAAKASEAARFLISRNEKETGSLVTIEDD